MNNILAKIKRSLDSILKPFSFFVLGILITGVFMYVTLLPAFSNSSTPTIIGGATNGNIFGSVQLDELNVTDTGVWRFDTGGGPIIATFTYNAVNPTMVFNSSVLQSGITLGGDQDVNGNKLNNINTLSGGTISTKLVLETLRNNANTGNAFEIFTLDAIDAQQSRLSITGGVNIATVTITDTTWDFGDNLVNNIGSSSNDLGVTNTLAETQFVGKISGGTTSAKFIIETLRSQATPGNALEIFTLTGADAQQSRLSITGGVNSAEVTLIASNFVPASNNTLTIGVDAGARFAGGYFVDLKGKTVTTGLLMEGDILPLPSQYSLFEDGDVVCASTELFYFKLCDKLGDEMVLGVVHLLEKVGIIGYENITAQTGAIYGIVGYEPMLVIEGPKMVKLCDGMTVSRGELLIAGNDGCAFGIDSLNGMKNIKGVNVPLQLLARDRAFGIVWEDSIGPMVAVHIRAS